MRHRNKTKKLGRTKSHRRATLGNMARSIIEHQQIKTTLAKAKAARGVIERLITFGKKDTVAARRQAFKLLQNHLLVKKLFDEVAPTFADRKGGYTRVIKLGQRRGDGAELAVLQLVGFEPMIVDEKKSAGKKKKKEAPAKEKAEKKAAEEKEVEAKAEETPVEEKVAEEKETKKAEAKAKPEKKEKKTKKAPAKKETAKKEAKDEDKSKKSAKAKDVKEEKKKTEKAREEKPAKEKTDADTAEADEKEK